MLQSLLEVMAVELTSLCWFCDYFTSGTRSLVDGSVLYFVVKLYAIGAFSLLCKTTFTRIHAFLIDHSNFKLPHAFQT
jgi:hypothetical protein